jgi:hypothetical protein
MKNRQPPMRSAILRIVPFIGFLLVVFGTLLGDLPANLGIVLLCALGAASLAAWFVGVPNSNNGS